jgi:hypothetical protein
MDCKGKCSSQKVGCSVAQLPKNMKKIDPRFVKIAAHALQ